MSNPADETSARDRRFQVCLECDGEGVIDGLGAYTADEFAASFLDVADYRDAHHAAQKVCPCCKGRRVVTTGELADRRAQLADEAERAAELRVGC